MLTIHHVFGSSHRLNKEFFSGAYLNKGRTNNIAYGHEVTPEPMSHPRIQELELTQRRVEGCTEGTVHVRTVVYSVTIIA